MPVSRRHCRIREMRKKLWPCSRRLISRSSAPVLLRASDDDHHHHHHDDDIHVSCLVYS
jgi:hypothetical protein